MLSVFNYSNYKAFLKDLIRESALRGIQRRWAEAIQCAPAYLSQVLSESTSAHLSLEQADALVRALKLDSKQEEFFLLLVQYGRAGTDGLRTRIADQIRIQKEKSHNLKERLKVAEQLSVTDQARYYSHWIYAAIHVLVTIPQFQTRARLSNRLKLTSERLDDAVSFLVETGLLSETSGKLTTGRARLHLGTDSPLLPRHHTNWRMRAIESLDRQSRRDLHYSSSITVSRDDVFWIKERLIQLIQETKEKIRESSPEELHCLNLDFFEI